MKTPVNIFLIILLFFAGEARSQAQNELSSSQRRKAAVAYQREVLDLTTSLLVRTPTCSGVLVTPRHVLTAAHCVDGAKWVQLFPDSTMVEVSSHETFPNDLAVLRLKQPVTWISPQIFNKVRLQDDPTEDQFRLFVGAIYDSTLPNIYYCQDIDPSSKFIIKADNCALYPGTSGGPLFRVFGNQYKPLRFKIYGVASATIVVNEVESYKSQFAGVSNLSPEMIDEMKRSGLNDGI